jgi:hypothetical protein
MAHTTGGGYQIKVFDNNYAGSFVSTPRQILNIDLTPCPLLHDFEIGDVNDDGLPDIVACSVNTLKCFINDGTGHFNDNYQPVPSGVYFHALVLTNLDGDRFPDLVTLCSNISGGGIYLKGYLNTGGVFSLTQYYTGTVANPPNYLVVDWWVSDLIATDLSGHGGLSLICTGLISDLSTGFWVFKNHGDPAPMQPRHFTIQADQNENPYLSWTPNEEDDISSYRIWRALTLSAELPQDVTFTQIGEVNHPINHFSDEDVFLHQPTFNYMIWYYVTAVDNSNNESEPSDTINFRGLYHPQSNGPGIQIAGVSLLENYAVAASPNPFNPSTTLNFSLPEATRVNLSVYDMNGRQVVQLVNALRPAGTHQVTFDGADLPAGIYFYYMQAGKNTASGKMVLMK